MIKNKKGFTIIELIVVVAILGILVLLAGPRLLGYVEKAELARIQHDVKVMENKMAEVLTTDNKFDDWQNNGKDLGRVVMRKELYEKQGVAKFIDWEHLSAKWLQVNNDVTNSDELGMGGDLIELDDKYSTYKIIPKEYSYTINTKLKGTFYVSPLGKVYYEHDKPLGTVAEKESLACVAPETLNYEFSIINGKGTITGWTGTELHLIIPSSFLLEVDGVEQCVPVQVIGRAAFANGPLKSIVIPESVDTIEEDAFKETELTEVTIPHSVEYIGDNAFADTPLTNATIVNKPEYIVIGENAFGGVTPTYKPPTAKDLNIIFDTKTNTIISGGSGGIGSSGGYIGGSGGYIGGSGGYSGGSGGSSGGSGGYSGGSGGRVVTIPKFVIVNGVEYPVKEISQGAYQGSGLISVIMPEGLERIEDYAFAGNQLIGVTIPKSVNYIGNYAFAYNEATHTITGDVKGTIKSVVIKGNQYVGKIDGLGNITTPINGITLKDHIFITSSMGNHVIEDVGTNPEQPGDINDEEDNNDEDIGANPVEPGNNNNEDVNNKEGLMNPIEPRDPIGEEIGINSAEELAKIGQPDEPKYPLNGKYILTANIDLSGYSEEEGWVPIGNDSLRFTGSFNGNGYSITGLKINRPDTNYIGLFGYTYGATIENVALEDVDIRGSYYTGGLVGYAYESSVTNSYATGSVSGGKRTGGLVGYASSSTISNSYWDTETTGQNSSAGGEGKTTDDMKDKKTYTNWDFENTWEIEEGQPYPTLKNIAN